MSNEIVILGNIVVDFTVGTKAEKKSLILSHKDRLIYSDLSCFDPSEFYQEFSHLQGCFAAAFAEAPAKIEVHIRNRDERFLQILQGRQFTAVETALISCGFVVPRTQAMIVNEAYHAFHEGIASREDIDRAMKFGVNYPKGPFEWARGKERWYAQLLEELLAKTGDRRYLPHPSLYKE